MKTIILAISLIVLNFTSLTTKAQTYTTESKSCGACGKEVSINSRPGMTCPHCGARWGRENTSYSTNTYTSYDYNSYNNYYNSATTLSKCNVRSYPSTSADILGQASAYSSFDVVEVGANWVKIKYSYYDDYFGYRTATGYIHRSLVMLT
jgi:hypothetical protein